MAKKQRILNLILFAISVLIAIEFYRMVNMVSTLVGFSRMVFLFWVESQFHISRKSKLRIN